jgi:hypothetical protein
MVTCDPFGPTGFSQVSIEVLKRFSPALPQFLR